MRFLAGILAKASLVVDGVVTLNNVAASSIDTDKFLVIESGVVKYRTGSQVLSDIGAAVAAAGLPIGGTAGQILAKIDSTNYNAQWIDNYASQLKHIVKLGENMTIGTPVYVSSADGTNMIVSKASYSTEPTSSKVLGLLAEGGVTNDQRFVITEGLLAGINTSSALVGDPVWLGVNGAILFGVANKPVAPNHMVYLGLVTRAQQNNGEIFVKVQNGFEIDELHDVLITLKTNKDLLYYDSATALWKNASISTILGYTPANATSISGTVNRLAKFTSTSAVGDSQIFDNGTNVSIGTSSPVTTSILTLTGTASLTKSIFLDSTWSYQTSFTIRNGIYYTEFNLGGATKSVSEGGPGSFQIAHYNASTASYTIPITFFANGNIAFAGGTAVVPSDQGQTLQVQGSTRISTLAGTGVRMVVANASGVLSTGAVSSSITSGSGTTNYVSKWTPDEVTLGNSQIFDDGAKIGVGLTSPLAKFHVNGSIRTSAFENQVFTYAGAVQLTYTTGLGFNSDVVTRDGTSATFIFANNVVTQVKHTGVGANYVANYAIGTTAEVGGTTQNALIYGAGGSFQARRRYSDDISTNSSNGMYGVISRVFIEPAASAGILTGTVYAVDGGITINTGTVTSASGFDLNANIGSSNTSNATTVTNYHGIRTRTTIGSTSGGTTVVTNYYGIYISNPTINTTGSITNRWALYSLDTAPSYIAGNVGIGATNPGSIINTGAFFKPETGGKHLDILSPSNEAVLNLRSNRDTDGGQVGGIYFTRDGGQGDAHRHIGAIQVRQTSTGTLAGGSMLFFTKAINGGVGVDVARMTIDSGGNVYISSLAGSGTRLVVADANGVLSATTVSSSIVGGAGTTNYLAKFTASSTVGNSQIYDNGTNVGIGTATPGTNKLFVNGSTRVDGNLNVTTGAISASEAGIIYISSYQLTISSSGHLKFQSLNTATSPLNLLTTTADGIVQKTTITAIGGVSGTGTTNYIPKWTTNGTTLGNSQIFDDGTSVGIGTTTPLYRLDVNSGTSAASFRALSTNTTSNRVFYEATAGNVEQHFLYTGNQDWVLGLDKVDGNKFKLASADDGFASTKVTVTTAGNVGIGTSTPTSKLHVSGGSIFVDNANGSVIVRNGDATNQQQIRLRMSGNDGILDVTRNSGTQPNLIFGTEATERMRITAAGDVGLSVVPKTWQFLRGFQIGTSAAISGHLSAEASFFGSNFYYLGSSWKRITSGFSSQVEFGDGIIKFVNAGTSTADSDISYSERMRITSDGNVGIGTTSPTEKLTVRGNGAKIRIETESSPSAYFAHMQVNWDATNPFVLNSQGFDILGVKTTIGNVSDRTTYLSSYYDLSLHAGANPSPSSSNSRLYISINGNVGINTTSPVASAQLEVTSTTRGFLPPRMTASQRAAITSPAVGLVVYQTDGTEGLWIYTNANGWKALAIVA